MKIKPMLMYQLKGMTRSYFVVMAAVLALTLGSAIMASFTGNIGMLGGMELTTIIYLIIASINCYGEELKLSIQNAASRKTFYISTAICVVITAFVSGLGDTVLSVIGNACETTENSFNFASMYEQAYNDNYLNTSPVAMDYVKSFVLRFACYAGVLGFGKFVGALYYRLSKSLKIIVTLGVYLLIVATFTIDSLYLSQIIVTKIGNTMMWAQENSFNCALLGAAAAVIFFAASWIFTRRARVDDRN